MLPWNANKKLFFTAVIILNNQSFIYLSLLMLSLLVIYFIYWISRYQIKSKVTFLSYFIFISQDHPITTKKDRSTSV